MSTRLLLFAAVIFGFISCKNQDTKTKEDATATNPTDTTTVITEEDNLSAKFFYRTLEGTIAGKPVVMHLLKHNDMVDANYYYTDYGTPIFLYKDWDEEGADSLYLIENTDNGNGLSPKIALYLSENEITGIWKSGDNKTTYPIKLRESQTDGTLRIRALSYSDSAAYLKFPKDTPILKSTITVVMATDNDPSATWFNNELKKILDNGDKKYASLNLPQTAQAIVNDLKNNYSKDVDSSLVGVTVDDNMPHYFLNREYITTSNVVHNNNGYIILNVYNYSYTGGAHGDYATTMYCFDIKNQKKLQLSDIMKVDSVAIQNLLDKYYRKRYHLRPRTSLDQSLFVKHLAPNDNFYFGPKGLGFIYNPYEIAPYAAGEINVWIPFSELVTYLNPEFKERMGL